MIVKNHRLSDRSIQRKRYAVWIKFLGLIILLSLIVTISQARQITLQDGFEDQDLTQNPAWSGNLDDFQIIQENDNHLLQLNSEESGHSTLLTESGTTFGSWEFYYRPETGPSNNNRTFFILMSDSDDFNFIGGGSTSEMNGYALRAGDNSGHRAFKLGRVVNGNFQSSIITETETIIEEGVGFQVRVERTAVGDWQIFVGQGYGSTPVADSPVVNDDTFDTSSYFGMLVIYSSANRDKFYFDDIIITEISEGSESDDNEPDDSDEQDGSDTDDTEPDNSDDSDDSDTGDSESDDTNDTDTDDTEPDDSDDSDGSNGSDTDGSESDDSDGSDTEETGSDDSDTDDSESDDTNGTDTDDTEPDDSDDSEGSNGSDTDGSESDDSDGSDTEETGSDDSDTDDSESDDTNGTDTDDAEPDESDDSDGSNGSDTDGSDSDESGGSDTEDTGSDDSDTDDSESDDTNDTESDDTDETDDPDSEDDPEEEPEDLNVQKIEVIRSDQIQITFDQPIKVSTVQGIHFEVDQNVGHPVSVTLVSSQSVILTFEDTFQDGNYYLSIQGVESESGGLIPPDTNIQFTVQNPFYLTGAHQSGSKAVDLEFSLDVDIHSVSPENFHLSGAGHPVSLELMESNFLKVIFDSNIEAGKYELTLDQISSTDGWQIGPETTISITFFDVFEPGDLVISEFYYRVPVSWRTETYDRPQYIELYNRSDKRLNLRNMIISGQNISISRDLPIDPGEYLVITRGRPVFMNRFGERNFVEADEFPRLNLTTSGRIHLETSEGKTIEDLTYVASEWGGNAVSLERLSFDLDASYRGNWAESEDALSGSPGLPNTVTIPSGIPVALAVKTPEPRMISILFSRELLPESVSDLSNFTLDGGVDIEYANLADGGLNLILRTNLPLTDGHHYTFGYAGIEDLFGNRIIELKEIEFTFVNPFYVEEVRLTDSRTIRINFSIPIQFDSVELHRFSLVDGTTPVQSEVINSTTVELTFSEVFDFGPHRLMIQEIESFDPDINEQWTFETGTGIPFYRFEETQPGDILLNEFMFRPPAGVPGYVELYNRSDRFLNLRGFELHRRPGISNSGGVISGVDLPIEPNNFLVITNDLSQMTEYFGDGPWVEMNGYPGFTQTASDRIRLIDPSGDVIQEVEYNPQVWGGNGVSLERKSVDSPVNHIFNWGASDDERKGTPGMHNSIKPDLSGPYVEEVHISNDQSISVTFGGSVYLDVADESSFQINGGIKIEAVEVLNANSVLLHLNTSLNSGQAYTLIIRNIIDIFGNEMESTQKMITYYKVESAEPGDVVINEIMYNEPDDYSRYIELYNRSNKVIDLAGWQQANNTGTRRTMVNESALLQPGAYLVIAPNDDLLQIFPGISLLNAGTRLSALKNGGDSIIIANESGIVIDSLDYTPDWGGNGVALERRRADLPGIHRENWGESPSLKLGTPGMKNEIDSHFVLSVQSIASLSKDIVELHFNAPIQESSLDPGLFWVGDIQPDRADLVEPDRIQLLFNHPLSTGLNHLRVQSIHSPAGFTVDPDTLYTFMVFDEFEKGDVVINEFMYRPPEGYPAYVELFNQSDKLLNLQNWRLQRRQNATGNSGLITEEWPFEPGGYLVLTEDLDQLLNIFGSGNFMELSGFPSFSVSVSDQVRLQSAGGATADSLEYVPASWGGNEIALERLSSEAPSYLVENWAESKDPLLGTPGKPNSVEADQNPPELLSVHQSDNSEFVLKFDKRPDRNSATNLTNYSFHPQLEIAEAVPEQNRIRLKIQSEMVNGQIYDLTVTNIRDIFGNVMETVKVSVRYLELSESAIKEIVINEILYRRAQSGSPQFIEVYNRSEKNFDLSGWMLTNISGTVILPEGLLIPGESYKVFTDSHQLVSDLEEVVVLSNFRPFNSIGDQVVLQNMSGVTIDSLYYRSEWRENPPGVSLERRDPEALSVDPHNWDLSRSETGSTPGKQNSRFEPDESPPVVTFVNFFHPDSIEVVFDKFVRITQNDSDESEIDNSEMNNSANRGYIVSQTASDIETIPNPRFLINGIEVSVLKLDPLSGNRIVLDGSGVERGVQVSLEIENLGDYQGNELSQWDGWIAMPAEPGDLLINEIMYQPLADNRDGLPDQSEYLEIINTQSYPVSLEGILLHDEPDDNGSIVRLEPVSTRHTSIPSNGYLLIYPESTHSGFMDSRTARFFELNGDEMELTTLRIDRNTLNLTISGRAVYLADSTLSVIDQVHYSPDWHNPNLIDTRGIALERISTTLESDSPDNWSSSANIMGGTPGRANSIFQHPGARNEKVGITVEPNPFSPDGDGFEDHLFIHYRLDEPDYLIRIRIFDRYGRLVRNLVNGEAAGFEGTRIWDGRMDNGQNNRIGIYIILFNAFDSTNGRNLQFRETAVIARRF
jgi:hypothetical protein